MVSGYPISSVESIITIDVICLGQSISMYSKEEYFYPENNVPLLFSPVVAVTDDKILIVCNGGNNYIQQGLFYLYGSLTKGSGIDDINITWIDGTIYPDYKLIPGTNYTSKNPTIVADKNAGNIFHIAWEEGNNIKYCKATGSANDITFSNIETPSTSSGYKSNLYPSISLVNGNPILSWTGGGQRISGKIVAKDNSLGAATDKAVIVKKTGASWGDFQVVGSDVNYTNNNSVTSAENKTVIVWCEGNTPQSKWVKRTNNSYSTPKNLSHSGIQTQVVSGDDYFDMKSIVFNNNQLPYYFSTTTTNFAIQDDGGSGGVNKLSGISDTVVTFGRAGIVNINGVDFIFNTGDIILADSTVSFIEKPDTTVYQTDEELNQYTRSETFELSSNSNFYFSNLYYVINDEFADSTLTENDNVNFKAELVKAGTEEVVGVFDNIDYNLNCLDKYANIFYQVDCSGIEEGEYYLRIVTSVTTESTPQYSLANIMNETTDLEKIQFTQVNFSGNEQPFTYDLSQNYPNPFNPSTIINYQIPEDGFVTLKIYDILGREVKTLINEHKTTGRYEVNFDASSLASAVYIYSIKVNDFVSSKKMMLLK